MPSRGAEIPSPGAAYRCRVVDPWPHSRKNSRNLAAWAWERPSSVVRKGPLTRYFSWWRGQDLNLRPSGYEPDGLPLPWSRPVPSRTSGLGFRAFDVPVCTAADQPFPARGVEESVEDRRAVRQALQRSPNTVLIAGWRTLGHDQRSGRYSGPLGSHQRRRGEGGAVAERRLGLVYSNIGEPSRNCERPSVRPRPDRTQARDAAPAEEPVRRR